jgi:hypothetical protein
VLNPSVKSLAPAIRQSLQLIHFKVGIAFQRAPVRRGRLFPIAGRPTYITRTLPGGDGDAASVNCTTACSNGPPSAGQVSYARTSSSAA